MKVVVDTNVLIAANERATHANRGVVLACAQFLGTIFDGKHVLLEDNLDLAFTEYKSYLNFSGQPGVGDRFFDWYLKARWVGSQVNRVGLDPGLPVTDYVPKRLKSFDRADHKWIAIYLEGGGDRIVNATDSDWKNGEADLLAEGVVVLELA